MSSTDGNDNPITVRKKSGVTINDIGNLIDEVCCADNFDVSQFVIVGGTREIIGNVVPTQEIKENVDASDFLADDIHLSASGVDRVLSNLSLPKQTS